MPLLGSSPSAIDNGNGVKEADVEVSARQWAMATPRSR
jgi:hypothetical protein